MKHFLTIVWLTALTLCGAPAIASVVVTEIMYNPASVQTSDTPSTNKGDSWWEWVEVYNSGVSGVDIQNWDLSDDGGSGPNNIISTSFIIDPGDYVILTKQALADFNLEWGTSLDASHLITMASMTGFNNGGDRIKLLDSLNDPKFDIAYLGGDPEGMSLAFFGNLEGSPAEFEDDSNWIASQNLTETFQSINGEYGSPGAYNGYAVPEPTTVVLVLLGGLIISYRREEMFG